MNPRVHYCVCESRSYIWIHLAQVHTLLACSLVDFTNILVEVAASIFGVEEFSILKI
jgi:hypothetical protein